MKKKISILIGVVIIAILCFVGILSARVFDPFWNPFRPEPEEVIVKMKVKMEKIKTFHSETFFEILAKNEKELKLNGKFLTDSDNSDSKNPKSKGDFDFSISFDGTSFSFGGENILVGEKSFFKLTKTPTIPERFLETEIDFANILAGIKNRWIEIDSESISNWLREVVKEMPEAEGILPEMEKMTEIEKEMEEKMKKILEEKLATEKLF